MYIKEILKEIKQEKQKPDWAKWFHLSARNLGDKFEFTPRLPRTPYTDDQGNVIEDSITKRTSWAPSIEKAIDAIGMEGTYYIYAVKNLPGDVDLEDEIPKCSKRVGTEKKPYNADYDYVTYVEKNMNDPDWAKHITLDQQRKFLKRFKKDIKNCVPDAEDTKEHWATKPVVAQLIGIYKNKKAVFY